VRSGKVRYFGASSVWAWQFSKMQYLAELSGWTRFVSMQNQYSLMQREDEREMFGAAGRSGCRLDPVEPAGQGPARSPWGEQTDRSATDATARWVLPHADKPIADAVAALDLTLTDHEIAQLQQHYTPRDPTGC
jgi:aryl-alcohol dehydrogenase-like predicted oxidoreductase